MVLTDTPEPQQVLVNGPPHPTKDSPGDLEEVWKTGEIWGGSGRRSGDLGEIWEEVWGSIVQ